MTTTKRKLITALWAIPAVLVLSAAGYGAKMLLPPPGDLDYATTQTSKQGTFTATIEPGADPIVINQIHTWTIDVAMADGAPLDPSAITIDGGMPQHGHGLPTEPQVTRDLGDGKFEVEGMKFNMPGWWVVNVHVQTPAGEDQATFNLNL
jgi:hypothetical protein